MERILRQSEVIPYYQETAEKFEHIYDVIKDNFTTDYVTDLCELRGYVGEEQRQMIEELEIGICDNLYADLLPDSAKELGLLTSTGDFLLNGRYIVPIRDIADNLVALVGYIPDYQPKKYLTSSSPFFSKACQLFNFRQAYELSWAQYDGLLFVVEGIFDTLSMRSIGLPCVGVMGSSLEKDKGELLKFFKKVICIPDDDATGKKALNRYSRYGWQVPSNTLMVNLHGSEFSEGLRLKDMDDFVSWYEVDSVIETLLSLRESTSEIEDLYI